MAASSSAMVGMATMQQEYAELEQVSPSPGDPMEAHDTMVTMGLCNAGSADTAMAHNRYYNVVPFDHHRVMLRNGAYINASWLDRFDGIGDVDFVVGIGPTTASVTRFWQAVSESGVRIIVMLARPGEVASYFPEEGEGGTYRYTDHAGEARALKVSCVTEQAMDGGYMVKRDLELTRPGTPGGNTPAKITHFHFTAWPNYGVPQRSDEMARFLQLTSDAIDEVTAAGDGDGDGTNVFVHCSGGVGRSGTFLSALIKWRQLLATTESWQWQGFDALGISLVPIVTKLREQRHPWAVEGFEQYQFAYQLLAHLVAGMKEPPLFETGAG